MLYLLWILWLFDFGPYLSIFTNSLFFAILFASFVSDILRMAGAGITPWVYALVVAIVFVVACIAFVLFSRYQAREIRRGLSFNGLKNLSELPRLDRNPPSLCDEEKQALFARRRISTEHWWKYLLVGVQFACDLFLDCSLFKYYLALDPSPDVQCAILHLMTYFSWMTQLDDLHRSIRRLRDLSLTTSFLLFQIYRIKVRGQTSREGGAGTKLGSIKLESTALESRMRAFWTNPEMPLGELLRFGEKRHLLESEWQELLRLNALNSGYHKDYLEFLVEVSSDFGRALIVKARLDALDKDRVRKTEQAFVSFLQVFPQYVTKSITTIRGKEIAYTSHGAAVTDEEETQSFDTITAELAIGADSRGGERLLKYGHVSIVLHQLLNTRTSNSHLLFLLNAILSFIASVVAIALIFGLYISYFERVESGSSLLIASLSFPQHYASIALAGLMKFAELDGRFQVTSLFPENQRSAWEDPNIDFKMLGWDYLVLIEKEFEVLFSGFSWLMETADNVEARLQFNYGFIESNTVTTYCGETWAIYKGSAPLLEAVAYQIARLTRLIMETTDWTQVLNSTDWCTIVNTFPQIAQGFTVAFEVIMNQTVHFYVSFDAEIGVLISIIPVLFAVVLCAGLIATTVFFVRELEALVNLLQATDSAAKRQASEPLSRFISSVMSPAATQRSMSSDKGFIYLFCVCIILADCCVSAAAALLLYRAQAVGHMYLVFQQWRYRNAIRGSKAYMICIHTFNAIFSHVIQTTFTNPTISRAVVLDLSNQLDIDAAQLRLDDESHNPIAGYDSDLDYWVLGTGCPVVETPTTLHDVYNCSGGSQLIRVFASLAMTILDNLDAANGTLSGPEPLNMIHLLALHLDPVLDGTSARIDELAAVVRGQFTAEMVAICIAGLVAALVAFGVNYGFLLKLDTVHRVLISLLERLPPEVVATGPLLGYLLGRKRLAARAGMSTAQSIVHSSRDGIILAAADGTIDYLNPMLSEILGYSPEELLGQPIVRIFADDTREEMETQIRLLQDRQLGNEMCEKTVACRTNGMGAHLVLCHVIVLALSGANREVSDFVVIIKDVTEDHEREIQSQKAKEKSETLLYAIIPRSIVARMKAGTDPTFVVDIASIMFIDIIKFSEFSRNLTPEQIMGTLASIFGSFDARIARWGLVTKIKLIGDVYMCASGLFDDARPTPAAEEIVLYALECLQCLDDQNMKMDIALSVRIGINTGGPIIAGVLGNENRVFDIIGDAINIAARLQSTSMPNTIQMATATQEYIAGRNFPLQKRDNVVLKGKEGAVSTYLLTAEGSHTFLYPT
jgi:PAS domain S-box-containing protein